MTRTGALAGDLVDRLRALVAEQGVTYDEYRAAKQWLIDVGEAGEWPLVLDVFVESAVEAQAFAARPGSAGAIEGPYFLPGSPVLGPDGTLPMRPAEEGERLEVRGRVTDGHGTPLPGAVLDVWQADAHGRYSGFDAGVPDGLLRGKVVTGPDGRYALRTVRPAPYTIPLDGPTGRLVAAAGWSPWRPAHLHLKLAAEGHELVTTQLTFADSPHLDDDVARAVEPGLVVTPVPHDGALLLEHDVTLAPLGRPPERAAVAPARPPRTSSHRP